MRCHEWLGPEHPKSDDGDRSVAAAGHRPEMRRSRETDLCSVRMVPLNTCDVPDPGAVREACDRADFYQPMDRFDTSLYL